MKSSFHRKKSGQVVVFEQVLLFTLTVGVFISTYYIFNAYYTNYAKFIEDDQLDQVKENIVTNLLSLMASTNTSSNILLKIPRIVGTHYYYVTLNQSGLYIYIRGLNSKFSNLYLMNETFDLKSSTIPSARGKIIIYKTGKSIIIK